MMNQEKLKSVLRYDETTGAFEWLKGRRTGKVAGCLDKKGYVVIRIDRKGYFAHRLAWLYVHGSFPKDGLDHKNRVRNDNRIANLREADAYDQAQNTGDFKSNTSGYKGVCWHPAVGRFMARTTIDRKRVLVGFFDDASEAYSAILAVKAA